MSHKYDLAISFAGAQREIASRLSTQLDASGYNVFYDEFFQSELWGQDLSVALADTYARDARYCLILLSREYLERPWTVFERRNAISRFIQERDQYVLCLKIDDVDLPGFPSSIGYLSLKSVSESEVYRLLIQKLGNPNYSAPPSGFSPSDTSSAHQLIQACYRRAIYTRMESEVSLSAMHSSILQSLGDVMRITATIQNQHLQLLGSTLIKHLDAIDRLVASQSTNYTCSLPSSTKLEIDSHKLELVRILLMIRRVAQISIQLPFNLRVDHFFSPAEANAEPIKI